MVMGKKMLRSIIMSSRSLSICSSHSSGWKWVGVLWLAVWVRVWTVVWTKLGGEERGGSSGTVGISEGTVCEIKLFCLSSLAVASCGVRMCKLKLL